MSNLEESNEINESIAINLQHLPFQARRKTTTAAVFRDYPAKIKRFLQGVATKESGISLEPTKVGS